MLEVLRGLHVILRFIAAPTREIGDFVVKAPDHASYAYLSSQLWETVAPNTV